MEIITYKRKKEIHQVIAEPAYFSSVDYGFLEAYAVYPSGKICSITHSYDEDEETGRGNVMSWSMEILYGQTDFSLESGTDSISRDKFMEIYTRFQNAQNATFK